MLIVLTACTIAIRVEFLRCRARAMRFTEEVQMLREEQRRVLVSLEQEATMWERRAVLAVAKECLVTRQGAVAYAMRQCALRRKLATCFRSCWAAGVVIDPQRPAPMIEEGQELFTIVGEDSDDEMNLVKDYASDDE